jgi:hypothetical protein
MKTYLVVHEGKTYFVKGKKLVTSSAGIYIIGGNDETVAIFPIGAFVADKACIEEQKTQLPPSRNSREITEAQ